MSDISVVIPVRNFRTGQLSACIDAVLDCGAKRISEVIVVDFGSDEAIRIPAKPNTRIIRVEAECWSSAEATNIGVVNAKNPIIAKMDADMLVPKYAGKRLDAAARALEDGEAGMFLAQPIDLPQEIETPMAAKMAAEARDATEWGTGHIRPRWGEGGLVIFTVNKWNELGGLDTRFTDWGNEDNDFSRRMRMSGGRIIWMEHGTIAHVWHPPAIANPQTAARAAQNKKLFDHDKSVYRPNKFRNSNFADLATPDIMARIRPMVTLAIATSDRENRDQMIVEAITRFRGQIDHDFETVIVENGSSKAATARLRARLAKIEGMPQPRIETLEQASIPAAGRNLAAQVARGRYICVVDDDDLALPNRLVDHLRPFQKDPNLHGTHGGWIDFDDETGVIEINQGKHRTIETLLAGTGKVTAHPACFYRTDVMRAIPYDESFDLGSDLDVAVRQGLSGIRIGHTGSFVVLRRFHAANVTRTGFSKQVNSGSRSRTRALEVIGASRRESVRTRALRENDLVPCTPNYSFHEIVELMPDYAGLWTLFCSAEGIPNAESARAADFAAQHGAEICTLESGIDQTLVLRFAEVKTAKAALELQTAAENALQCPVMILPSDEMTKLRKAPFEWARLVSENGAAPWVSPEYVDLRELLSDMAALPAHVAEKVLVISDHTEAGETYYLALRDLGDDPAHFVWLVQRSTGRTFKQTPAFLMQRTGQGEF